MQTQAKRINGALDKDYYRALKPNGYQWFGLIDGLHHFSKEIESGKWAELRCREEQITNGDLEFMAEHGLTL